MEKSLEKYSERGTSPTRWSLQKLVLLQFPTFFITSFLTKAHQPLWWRSIIWYFRLCFLLFFLHMKTNNGHIEELSMVWGIFCIFLIWVVVIHFYPKSFNFIGVLSLFSEKWCKSKKQNFLWRLKDMKIEDQWFLEGFWRESKLWKIHPIFQCISRQKNTRKRTENNKIRPQSLSKEPKHMAKCSGAWETLGYCLTCTRAWLHAPRSMALCA
jgi:hypothetical protein